MTTIPPSDPNAAVGQFQQDQRMRLAQILSGFQQPQQAAPLMGQPSLKDLQGMRQDAQNGTGLPGAMAKFGGLFQPGGSLYWRSLMYPPQDMGQALGAMSQSQLQSAFPTNEQAMKATY